MKEGDKVRLLVYNTKFLTSTMNAIIQCKYTYKYMGVVGSLAKNMQVW